MLKTELLISRFDGQKRLIESRRQLSRSWVKGLIAGLYLPIAHILYSAPYVYPDVLGSAASLSSESSRQFLVNSPPGGSDVLGSEDNVSTSAGSQIPSELIGIQLGADSTPVTPTDTRLGGRIWHGNFAPDAISAKRAELAGPDDTSSTRSIYGASYWNSIAFAVDKPMCIDAVKFIAFRNGNPSTLTVSIQEGTLADWTKPSGTDLCSGTIDANGFSTTPGSQQAVSIIGCPVLVPGRYYHAVFKASGGNSTNYVMLRLNSAYVYTIAGRSTGAHYYTSNGGSSWSNDSIAPVEIWGTIPSGGLIYGGCEVHSEVYANPNAQFSIIRRFTNKCGANVTVRECGIYAQFSQYYTGTPPTIACFAICVARDVIAPDIVLANGEILEVEYIPRITV